MKKYVYNFAEGSKEMRELLGGKGANLAEMLNLGLPVPLGFTITTEACRDYYNQGEQLTESFIKEVLMGVVQLENETNRQFGDPLHPLLLSVRSGARESMPGMMNTILNLGLNDEIVEKWASRIPNPRFAYDSYRRLIQMYADVVMDLDANRFEDILTAVKQIRGVNLDTDLNLDELKLLVESYKVEYRNQSRQDFPQDVPLQLIEAVKAVFRSWNTKRAKAYRELNHIPDDWGTAVNVQQMVYGNISEQSGTGVVFSRNPSTGEDGLFGEFMMNAQGEDIVAGIRTPMDIEKLAKIDKECYQELVKHAKILERHYKDMQDMEFTIENGKLFMLQTRNGKRTAKASIKIAVDLVNEGMITKEEALLKVDAKGLDNLLHFTFNSDALKNGEVIANGLAASPGAGAGKIYFTAEDVIEHAKAGEKTILVRLETSPEDIEGMNHAEGILTVRGGMTSHAAVVARGMGICCVSGCSELTINEEEKTLTTASGKVYKQGDEISLDGSTGRVYDGLIETEEPTISGDFKTFMNWADEIRRLEVRTNADTPKDAIQARKFGAEGIGLCRTEHMFFEESRIFNFRKMITAETTEQREKALEDILPYQREDFEGLFRAMAPYTVTIRYLDPPLHEFLPHTDEEIKPLAESLGMSFEALKKRIESLKELNPMMGHRGCRLAVTYPEIAKMQTRAVIEAAINVNKDGLNVEPEIMIPLIGDTKELKYVKNIVCETADKIIKEQGVDLKYSVGTMIEIPRAALTADKIAEDAEFFSFGTNDLTQMTYGFSRDDAGKFLEDYYSKSIFESDPFAKVDQEGVGTLMKIAIEKGKKTRPNIKLGICGEHGGDPSTVEFCHEIGLTYVSCSPYRVPLARLAAAQAKVKETL